MRPRGRYTTSSAAWLIIRISAFRSRRRSMASQVKRPWRQLPLALPFGAPGDFPPCIRHRPFGIAGDRHGLPLLVFAPQRGDRCMPKSFCIGLLPFFARHPTSGLHSADNGLPAGVDMDVLDRDLLLPLTTVSATTA